jgi:hypothetical protein
MEGTDAFERFVRGGLEGFGLTPDPAELAVIKAVDAVYGDQMRALMHLELADVESELEIDLSRPPP